MHEIGVMVSAQTLLEVVQVGQSAGLFNAIRLISHRDSMQRGSLVITVGGQQPHAKTWSGTDRYAALLTITGCQNKFAAYPNDRINRSRLAHLRGKVSEDSF